VVTFGISFRETKATVPGDTVCCTVDVSVDRGNVLASQPVSVSMLGDPRDILAVPFELPTVSVVEYRVYVHGNAELVIDCDRPVLRQAANGGINLPRPLKITDSDNPVFRCCFEQFLDYHNKGAAIEPIGDGTIMEYLGLRLKIRNREDFQILWEVLLRNTYNFCTSKEVCVVDIGMNAGFASLFFSRMSHVKLVYAFEPFRVPFNRALENFALNAELQPKIKAYNFGLGAATQELSVLYDENNTLSGSVLGRDFGVDTKISIRDASDVLRRIVHEVKPLGLDIVIKMDCEGSEFPIFETLDLHGLLPEVQMFMIEWHKWWSPGRTQQELISRLLANGFNVFDHTDLFDPYAGALYAVRSSLPAPTEMTA
jgi:FkbM family methyltransferase